MMEVRLGRKRRKPPDIPVRAILQNPLLENEVIVGTELGVWFIKNFDTDNPAGLKLIQE